MAEEALALAETRLGYATITSPISGYVLSKISNRENMSLREPPLSPSATSRMCGCADYIDERDLVKIKIGQKVNVTNDTFPGKVYQGQSL